MDFPFLKEAITQLFSAPSTERFPAVAKQAPPKYRGRIVLDADKCVCCNMCMRVCAAGAITQTIEKNEAGEDVVTMELALNSCTFCGVCADFCVGKGIHLTTDYDMVATNEDDLIIRETFIKKPPKRPAAPPPKPAAQQPAQPADGKPADEACQRPEA